MSNPERIIFTSEHKSHPESLQEAGHEHHERLRQQREKIGEMPNERLDEVRREALEKATSNERDRSAAHEELKRPLSTPEHSNQRPISKRESFSATMQDIRSHMSVSEKTFSKVIHNKTIEKVSDIGASTVARPNAILSGAILAFTLTLAVYLIAKNQGYVLSGFETIGAFILGWIIGLGYDFLKIMITGKK
jgi:hypothetical protein